MSYNFPSTDLLHPTLSLILGILFFLRQLGTGLFSWFPFLLVHYWHQIMNKIKRQPTKWENIFTNISNKELISKIYTELKKLNTKKTEGKEDGAEVSGS